MSKRHRSRNRASDKQQIIFYALIAWFFLSVAYIISNNITSLRLGALFATTTVPNNSPNESANANQAALIALEKSVFPAQGFVINAKWGTSIKQLVLSRALNVSFLNKTLAQDNQSMTVAEKQILNGTYNNNITTNRSNSAFMLYVLWALGINNKNPVINNGPIMKYGGDSYSLASTGGYGPVGTLQLGKLSILNLTQQEQAIANYTAQNTYRPCCNNPTFFPDCNHGAAALGLVELMASQGASQQDIFRAVEEFNAIQFPQQYLYTAAYFASKNTKWKDVAPQIATGSNYSSASGSAKTLQYLRANKLMPSLVSGGSSCGA